MDAGEYSGKIAFVTGAARGFGKAFVEALAERGAIVVIAEIDTDEAAKVAATLNAAGHRALALACDVADEASVARAVAQTVEMFGGIDILINNAGLHSEKYSRSFAALGHAEIRRCIDVNIMGAISCSLACRPAMAARGGGVIVNIASIAARVPTTIYGVTKLAVRGLTIAFAHEFAPDAIRVNAIAPGLIGTDTIRAELPELFDRFVGELQKIHRAGEVEDIVEAMLFLVSPRASFITGETLQVSGGYPLAI